MPPSPLTSQRISASFCPPFAQAVPRQRLFDAGRQTEGAIITALLLRVDTILALRPAGGRAGGLAGRLQQSVPAMGKGGTAHG
jgi:hypothetical protein